MNRIDKLFREKKNNILSVYFTAGYPKLDSTVEIIKTLAASGADMIEIGMPFSDPMADGPVIQRSNQAALQNGMNLKLLFDQLKNIRNEIKIPLIIMGYLNPVLQYGVENFCSKAAEAGIDGVIIPDLPPEIYKDAYLPVFGKHNIYNILLVTPQSPPSRISEIDKLSRGFIYMVSTSSVTGGKSSFSGEQISYFKRVGGMKLNNPCLIGFGISNRNAFSEAGKYSRGGIIGSAFIKAIGKEGKLTQNIIEFIREFKSIE
jgi:tryptophan synthase alpha chain